MTINVELNSGWKQTESPKMIYLISSIGKIIIYSDSLNHANLVISVTSCTEAQKLNILVNQEILYSEQIACEIFKKISFECVLLEGANYIDFLVISNNNVKNFVDSGDDNINYILAIKDFEIIRCNRIKII